MEEDATFIDRLKQWADLRHQELVAGIKQGTVIVSSNEIASIKELEGLNMKPTFIISKADNRIGFIQQILLFCSVVGDPRLMDIVWLKGDSASRLNGYLIFDKNLEEDFGVKVRGKTEDDYDYSVVYPDSVHYALAKELYEKRYQKDISRQEASEASEARGEEM
jgi:hypothetical protein